MRIVPTAVDIIIDAMFDVCTTKLKQKKDEPTSPSPYLDRRLPVCALGVL